MNNNITDYLYQHALSKPDDVAFRFLNESQSAEEISFKKLWLDSYAIANFISKHASTGDRVLLLYPSGLAYVKAFFGCLIAGVIAVPLYPPRKNKKSARISSVVKSCNAHIALTTTHELPIIKECWNKNNKFAAELVFYSTDNIFLENKEVLKYDSSLSGTPAFLQYTSGSTGDPKGVIISHENIMANVKLLSITSSANNRDVFVNWLPLFHDLGLVTTILLPVWLGVCSILMPPTTFIVNPIRWLKAISFYRGTACGAPNFAYDLCVSKISNEDLLSLDLSCWRIAYNAAEPVKAETLEHFSEKFSVCGFKNSSFYPSYGMAEATAFINGGKVSEKPKVEYIDKKKHVGLQHQKVNHESELTNIVVSCGSSSVEAPHDIKIVDPRTNTQLSDGEVGEIWFSGPSVSSGYWQLEKASKETFGQRIAGETKNAKEYLRTGDYGVMWQGELYVTGRIKDLIILNGINHYPQDIEASVVKAHESVRPGFNAAFCLVEDGCEKLAIVTEIEREYFRRISPDTVINSISQQIFNDHQVKADYVVLLKPHKIPTTSSGKIQRNKTKMLLKSGELNFLAHSSNLPAQVYIKPETQVEEVIHNIWCSVLKKESISVKDDFFEVGGDSIKAIQISAEIEKTYQNLSFDMEQLVELSTIKDIAQFIELRMLHRSSPSAVPFANSSRTLKI